MISKIGTLNARGGGNKIERIIRTLSQNGNSVTCLQEMHEVTDISKREIEKKCKGSLYICNGTTQSRGVATFVRDQEGMKSSVVAKGCDGRLLVTELSSGDDTWTICNVYAPNDAGERHDFFREVSRMMERAKGRIVITGDFNCTLDRYLDRTKSDSKGATKSDKSKKALLDLMTKFKLVDTYRRLHPLGTAYSFTGSNGYRARLDRVYADQDSATGLTQVTLQAISYSDHDLVSATFGNVEEVTRWGQGRWMLNVKLLFDERTKEDLKECIREFKSAKICFPSILQWWDELKLRMKSVMITHGKRVKKEQNRYQQMLETELNILVCKTKVTEGETERIRELKRKLEEIQKDRDEGSRVRSKEEWIDRREKCARYFYEEEKRKGKLKIMSSVLDEEGQVVSTKEGVCETTIRFYEKLLTREDLDETNIEKLVDQHIRRKLSESEKMNIDGIIKKEEVLKALKEMSNNKSPGLDGLPSEFYKIMWNELGNDLSDTIANVCLSDEIPDSWTEGLISIIYKEKGDIRDLKNWRPITLLNCDYKIMTKVMANRIKDVSNNLVSADQSCGLKNRTIHDQLYYIRDFIHYFSETNKKGMIISIDQEKCFDRIDHRLIHVMLKKLNFGPVIQSLVKTIYANMRSRIMINGLITDSFQVTRSVRQGDSLSMSLAVLVGELLGEMLRANMEITPICLPNTKPKKVAQYADDTSILTDNPRSLNSLWKTIYKYEKITGAKINQTKTEILLVGKWPKKKRIEVEQKCAGLVKRSVKILGVYFGGNAEIENERIIEEKVQKELERWKDRNISMKGKVDILRVLVTSKIWHIARVTGLRRSFILRITKEMVKFFWYPKTYHAIRLEVLQNQIENGGKNFPNLAKELEAYLTETVAIAAKHPQKSWVGMLRYRQGGLLEDILPKMKNVASSKKETRISTTIGSALGKLKGKVDQWEKIDYRKLLYRLKEDVPTTGNKEIWKNIGKSSKCFKRVDLNYLIAHERLPLADFLYKKGIAADDKCKLCCKTPETHMHLFYECALIDDLKNKLITELTKANRNNKFELTFHILTRHTPKVAPRINEILSAFKQSIWQTRAALYYNTSGTDTKSHLYDLFTSKMI